MTRFGIQLPDFRWDDASRGGLFPRAAAVAQEAEAAGFPTLWVMDHFHQLVPLLDRGDPMPEGYVLLGGLAARTELIELGTMVTGVTYRNPGHLAKLVTTLDHVSGGRAILGVGASWHEDEYRSYGFGEDLPSVRERLDRLEDALRIARAMFAAEESSVEGTHTTTSSALNNPPPLRPGGPPIMIGGSGEKRLLRLVAEYGDMSNVFGDPETVRHKMAVLDAHCEDVGRDPAEVERTRLGGVILRDTDAEAERAADAILGGRIDDGFRRAFFTIGGPERVREGVEAFLDAGLDQPIFSLVGPPEPGQVTALGEVLAPLRAA